LIRRASFYRAGLRDGTDYWAPDLSEHTSNEDVASARLAAGSMATRDIARWAAQAGPLPNDPTERGGYVDVVRRGMEELRAFFGTIPWP
jgi:hypothetical protein